MKSSNKELKKKVLKSFPSLIKTFAKSEGKSFKEFYEKNHFKARS